MSTTTTAAAAAHENALQRERLETRTRSQETPHAADQEEDEKQEGGKDPIQHGDFDDCRLECTYTRAQSCQILPGPFQGNLLDGDVEIQDERDLLLRLAFFRTDRFVFLVGLSTDQQRALLPRLSFLSSSAPLPFLLSRLFSLLLFFLLRFLSLQATLKNKDWYNKKLHRRNQEEKEEEEELSLLGCQPNGTPLVCIRCTYTRRNK